MHENLSLILNMDSFQWNVSTPLHFWIPYTPLIKRNEDTLITVDLTISEGRRHICVYVGYVM